MKVDINKLKEYQKKQIKKQEKKLEELEKIQQTPNVSINNIADGYFELYYKNNEGDVGGM